MYHRCLSGLYTTLDPCLFEDTLNQTKYCKTLQSYFENIQLKFFPPVTDYMLRNGAEIWGVLLTEVSQSYLAGEAGAC